MPQDAGENAESAVLAEFPGVGKGYRMAPVGSVGGR